MIDLLAAKRSCLPMGNRLYIGGSSSSKSANTTTTTTTDNRAVAGDNAFMIGAGASFQGVDPGMAKIAEFNHATTSEVVKAQTDATKFFMNAGADVLNKMGESVTDIYARSGANTAAAWSHTIDASATALDKLTAGAKANADAAQTVAVAALNANKSDASGLSDAFKYTAIAAAVVAGVWLWGRNK